MSTILIDRRTAELLGELAAAPRERRPRPSAHAGGAPARVARKAPAARVSVPVRATRRTQVPLSDSLAVSGARAVCDAPSTRPSRTASSAFSGGGVPVTDRGGRVAAGSRAARGRKPAVVASPARPSRPATAAPRSPGRPGLHLTRRGRLVALLLLLVVLTVAFSVGRVTSTALGGSPAPGQEVVVQPGETLWSIAERVAPDADPRSTVGELMAVNGLSSPSLDAGQRLRLP